jgi:translation initiation factor 3 subunit B
VDGIPIVDRSKYDRLVTKIVKEFGKRGSPIKAEDIFMPFDEVSGKSKGCVLDIHLRALLISEH